MMSPSRSLEPGGALACRRADSYYAATVADTIAAPALSGDAVVDHCVIGGGFAGLGAALALARAGQRVRLIEAGPIGDGASGRNGGQVHIGWQQDQATLTRRLGHDLARAMWQAALAARQHFDTLIALDGDACDYRPGLIHADHRARDVPATHAHVALMRDEWGHDSLTALDREALCALLGSEAYYGGSFDSAGGHCHPLKLVQAIARAATAAGAVLHGDTRCTALARTSDAWRVTTPRGTILAGQVLDASGAWARRLVPAAAARVLPIANYIATTAPLGAEGARALIANGAAVSDGRFVVYYFRTTPDHRLLFGGGETYGTRAPADIAAFVRPHLLRVFPQLAGVPIDHAWGGLLAVSPDRLPFIVNPAPGLYALNGFSGLGVVLAPWLGDAVGQAMAGIANPGYDLLCRLPAPRFPGGPVLRWPTQALTMRVLALLDRW